MEQSWRTATAAAVMAITFLRTRLILALVERGGRVRAFHVPVAGKQNVQQIVRENIARESRRHTDESRLYFGMNEHFTKHETRQALGRRIRARFRRPRPSCGQRAKVN